MNMRVRGKAIVHNDCYYISDKSTEYWPTKDLVLTEYRPSIDWYIDQYIDWHIGQHIDCHNLCTHDP